MLSSLTCIRTYLPTYPPSLHRFKKYSGAMQMNRKMILQFKGVVFQAMKESLQLSIDIKQDCRRVFHRYVPLPLSKLPSYTIVHLPPHIHACKHISTYRPLILVNNNNTQLEEMVTQTSTVTSTLPSSLLAFPRLVALHHYPSTCKRQRKVFSSCLPYVHEGA